MLTEPRFTAMAAAFYIACINAPRHPLCPSIGNAIQRNRGLIKVRSWNANLSFKTARNLQQKGIL
ncbi:MAG: hypothetical protein ACK4K3_07530 [Aquabacterium sp.]